MAFVLGIGRIGKPHPARACSRRKATEEGASAQKKKGISPEEQVRMDKMFEYYEAWDGSPPNRADGWVLFYGPELGMWKNSILEAGIAPKHEVFSRFIPDVELEFALGQRLKNLYLLLVGTPEAGSLVTLNVQGDHVVLAFESPEDATRYAVQMEGLGMPLAKVMKEQADDIINYAKESNMYRAVIPAGTMIAPPQSS
ncbi:hypothetical protein NDN08_004622 [Rhodosorus marinus]|uniref:Uncharacterized protein n=1 Tax=Rhodosorus marinus TaxID=101924 RepID=A0AAV8ULV2_9RHOD|nr:hypothetical protein NDN08_004622 [Rhodosorus marinus]